MADAAVVEFDKLSSIGACLVRINLIDDDLRRVVVDDRNVDIVNRQTVVSGVGAGRRMRDEPAVIAFADGVIGRVNDDRLRRERVCRRERQLHGNAGAVADVDLRIGRNGDDDIRSGHRVEHDLVRVVQTALDNFGAAQRFADSHAWR